METKAIATEIIDIDEVTRTITGVASVFGNVDDGFDVIENGAFTKTLNEGQSRVKHLWQHNWMKPPTAKIVKLEQKGKKSLPKTVLAKSPDATGGLFVTRTYLDSERANEIYQGVLAKAINEMSIGFDPILVKMKTHLDGKRVRHIKEARLWDTSDVNWGMNAATVAQKSALPFKQTPTADKDADFDIESETKKIIDDRTAPMFIYAYKSDDVHYFLHHHIDDEFSVNFKAVKACIIELYESNLEEAEIKSVYDHLTSHLEQFDEESMDFELFESGRIAKNLIKRGFDGGIPELKSFYDSVKNSMFAAEPNLDSLTAMERLNALELDLKLLEMK